MDAVLELCPELKIIHFVQNVAKNYMQEAYNLTSLDLYPILFNRMRKVFRFPSFIVYKTCFNCLFLFFRSNLSFLKGFPSAIVFLLFPFSVAN